MNEHLLASMVVLLLIACVVAIIAQWLKQPYTVALVLVGLMVAITKVTPDISISHNVIFMIVLPPLLFQGALHMDLSQLKDNWKSIALIVGLPEDFPMRHLFLTVGFGVVLFTLIVQAVTMRPLVRRLEMGST